MTQPAPDADNCTPVLPEAAATNQLNSTGLRMDQPTPPAARGDSPILGALIESVTAPLDFVAWLLEDVSTDYEMPNSPHLQSDNDVNPTRPVPNTMPLAEIPIQALSYALLQCTNTLVWGIRQGTRWVWASGADKSVICPEPYTLLEARVFGPDMEVLIWREEPLYQEQFYGRILRDDPKLSLATVQQPLLQTLWFEPPVDMPVEENAQGQIEPNAAKRMRIIPGSLFVRRSMPGGNITVTPPGRGVQVIRYLQENEETGALRVAASRARCILE